MASVVTETLIEFLNPDCIHRIYMMLPQCQRMILECLETNSKLSVLIVKNVNHFYGKLINVNFCFSRMIMQSDDLAIGNKTLKVKDHDSVKCLFQLLLGLHMEDKITHIDIEYIGYSIFTLLAHIGDKDMFMKFVDILGMDYFTQRPWERIVQPILQSSRDGDMYLWLLSLFETHPRYMCMKDRLDYCHSMTNEFLRWQLKNRKFPTTGRGDVQKAIAFGDIERIEALRHIMDVTQRAELFPPWYDVFYTAVLAGRLDVVLWTVDQGYSVSQLDFLELVWQHSSENGHLDILKWIYNLNIKSQIMVALTRECLLSAAVYNHSEVRDWLIQNGNIQKPILHLGWMDAENTEFSLENARFSSYRLVTHQEAGALIGKQGNYIRMINRIDPGIHLNVSRITLCEKKVVRIVGPSRNVINRLKHVVDKSIRVKHTWLLNMLKMSIKEYRRGL